MNLIVVVDEKWGIGKNNGLLFRLKKDMEYFKQTTTGKVVVMGANTYASFPNGALKNRVNVVLDDSGKTYPDATAVSSVESLFELLKSYSDDDIFVIGGASVYKLLLNDCKRAFVTKVEADGGAELFFPNLDQLPNWQLVDTSDEIQDGNYKIRFCIYVNNELA
ncbi:MAG: dihydrofolate reductase [Clostridiales bacterium]|nr:dihydrofolate reductase [Clostridiales bacterium]